MATDLTLTSDQQLLALINEDNASALTDIHVLLDSPAPLVDDPDGKNTSLTVVSRPNGGYNGSVNIKYDRLNLNGFEAYGDPILVIPDGGGLAEVVSTFNTLYSANLTVEDDIDEAVTLPTLDYTPQAYTLTANAESLAFIGSIEITVQYQTTDLDAVIVNVVYDGLDWPTPLGELLDGTITNLASLPSSRYELVSAEVNGVIYYIGGRGTTGGYGAVSTNVFRYDIASNSFATLGTAAALPTGVCATTVGVDNNGDIFVFGGILATTNTTATVMKYDTSENSWSTLTDCPFGARYNAAYASYDNKLYVMGGTSTSSSFLIYDMAAGTWVEKTLPAASTHGSAVALSGKIFLSGGFSDSVTAGVDTMYCYDIADDSWDNCAVMPGPRTEHNMVEANGRLYVFNGGATDTAFEQNIWVYNPNLDSWSVLADANLDRKGSAACSVDGVIYFGGGKATSASLATHSIT